MQARGLPVTQAQRERITVEVSKRADAYQEAVASAAATSAQEGSTTVASMLQAAGIRVSQDMLSDFTVAKLTALVFTASERTIERLVGNVNAALVDAQNAGMGIDEAARYLRDGVFTNMRTYEAARVARTEIQGAQNWGAFQTLKDYSPYTVWWTALDTRVRTYGTTKGRADHTIMHGQIVKTGDPFSNGLLHPGDRNGPIAEWINCRCRPLPFIMPANAMAPIGRPYFTEAELVWAA
jgi:uncharacterized protein with gpF-like domain